MRLGYYILIDNAKCYLYLICVRWQIWIHYTSIETPIPELKLALSEVMFSEIIGIYENVIGFSMTFNYMLQKQTFNSVFKMFSNFE